MTDDATPSWPPAPGDKVLHRHTSGDPGPTYVLTEPEVTPEGRVVETVTHHQIEGYMSAEGAPVGIENPVERAREAIDAGELSPRTQRVDRLQPYDRPRCERCENRRATDRPARCSLIDDDRQVWLCRYCLGVYDGLKAGLDDENGAGFMLDQSSWVGGHENCVYLPVRYDEDLESDGDDYDFDKRIHVTCLDCGLSSQGHGQAVNEVFHRRECSSRSKMGRASERDTFVWGEK